MAILQPVPQFSKLTRETAARSTPPESWHGFRQHDDADAMIYELPVPGYRRRHLSIEIADGVITVRGKRTKGWFKPRSKKSFLLSFNLPETVDEQNVAASLMGEVLQLRVAKKPYARRRNIPISYVNQASTRASSACEAAE